MDILEALFFADVNIFCCFNWLLVNILMKEKKFAQLLRKNPCIPLDPYFSKMAQGLEVLAAPCNVDLQFDSLNLQSVVYSFYFIAESSSLGQVDYVCGYSICNMHVFWFTFNFQLSSCSLIDWLCLFTKKAIDIRTDSKVIVISY